MNLVYELFDKYGLKVHKQDYPPNAMGIGDLLFGIVNLQESLFDKLYINVNVFQNDFHYKYPLNALEFRLKLLIDIFQNHKSLTFEKLIFFNSDKNLKYNQDFNFPLIKNFNIESNIGLYDTHEKNKYIIFHTKLRLFNNIDYLQIKNKIKIFCENFKTNYTIIILGEKKFQDTNESIIHGITTIYDELLNLKKHNQIEDLTKNDIYNDLDYDEYKKDLLLIKNAKLNICIGLGGQLCSSLIFGTSTFFYYPNNLNYDIYPNVENLKNNNNYYFDNLDNLFTNLSLLN